MDEAGGKTETNVHSWGRESLSSGQDVSGDLGNISMEVGWMVRT